MKKNKLLQSVKVIVLGLIISFGITSVFSAGIETGKTGSVPPSNNVPGPINTGTLDQIKDGGLSVNAFLVAGDSFFNGLVTLGNFTGGGDKQLCVDNNGNITTTCPEVIPVGNSPVVALPTVTTSSISAITQTTATSGGNVTSDGGAAVTARGIVWSTSLNPTISDSHTTDGSGTGVFTSSITGLLANTTYYVRAYATNSVGTAYGNHVQFTTTTVATLPTVKTSILGQYAINNLNAVGSKGIPVGVFVTDTGGVTVTKYGFVFKPDGSGSTNGSTVNTNQDCQNNPPIVYSLSDNANSCNYPMYSNTGGTSCSTSAGTSVPNGFVGLADSRNNAKKYCIRAYAINSVGTNYGDAIFVTAP